MGKIKKYLKDTEGRAIYKWTGISLPVKRYLYIMKDEPNPILMEK